MPRYGKKTVDFKIEAGFTVQASSAAIAFLWSNWHVLYAFRPDRIRSVLTFDDQPFSDMTFAEGSHWHAKGLGGEGDWWLQRAEIGIRHGRFTYFTRAHSLTCPIQAKTFMEYDRVDDSWVSYRGRGVAALPKLFLPLHPVLRILASRIALYINGIGGEVAELITKEPEQVATVVNEDAFLTYKRFIDEEREIRAGKRSSFTIFTAPNQLPHESADDLTYLEKKLERIEALLESLHSKIVNIEEYRGSLSVFSQDHNLALVKNRMIVSKIVEIIYKNEIGEGRQTGDLVIRLEEIRKKSLNVPERILTLIFTVANLGDQSSQASLSGVFDSSLYAISFESTLRITEWFFVEYLARRAALGYR